MVHGFEETVCPVIPLIDGMSMSWRFVKVMKRKSGGDV
jgi:hypothetical protein